MTNEPVMVEQCDRNAAVKIYRKRRGGGNLAINIRDGYVDDDEIVQLFAHHRIAALSQPARQAEQPATTPPELPGAIDRVEAWSGIKYQRIEGESIVADLRETIRLARIGAKVTLLHGDKTVPVFDKDLLAHDSELLNRPCSCLFGRDHDGSEHGVCSTCENRAHFEQARGWLEITEDWARQKGGCYISISDFARFKANFDRLFALVFDGDGK